MCLASVAGAASTLVGGGATLPAIGYTGKNTFPSASTPITPAAGSLFGVYTTKGGNPVTYCPIGSGLGTKIFAGNDPAFDVNALCGGTDPSGFGGSGLAQAHFVASDTPLSVSGYNNYVIDHGVGTQPTQLPAIAGEIVIAFKKQGVLVNAIKLTEGQICGIFSGQITDWSELAASGGVPADTTPGPITVVYRNDDSGTSFALLNHLSDVCRTVNSPGGTTALGFKTKENYATGAAPYLSLYATSVAANGSAGVASAVHATEGSIGYVDLPGALAGQVFMASVKNTANVTVSPLTGFGVTAIPVTLTFDKAISNSVDSNGRPILVDLPVTSNGCIAMVDPSSYSNPALTNSTSYPIVAISNLLGNAQGNGVDAAAVRALLSTPYDTTIRPSVIKVGRAGTGYAWLSNPGLTQARVSGCIN